MILRGLARGAGGVFLAGLLVSAAAAGPRMEVEVAVDDLEQGSLHVTMVLEGFADGSMRLRGVPTWVDNPMAEARGEVVRELRVFDAQGGEIPARFSRGESGEGGWSFRAAGTVEVTYRLDVAFQAGEMVEAYPVLVPFMDDRRAWLLGNHVFLTPEFAGSRVDGLLRALPVEVAFDLPRSMRLVGPPRDTTVASLFELLSLQFGLGDFDVLEVPAKDLDLRLAFVDPHEFSKPERERLQVAARDLAGRAVELFGAPPTPSIDVLLFRAEGFGGLEGAWALHAYLPEDVDLADPRDDRAGKFFTILAHELVHAWLPVTLFPLDDPWVKEGFTSWYGHVLAARGGWIGPAEVDRLFAGYGEKVFGEVELEDVALSDPELWLQEYAGENWRRVSYERGHAVTLLLDVHLRSLTDNRRSLDDVLRLLFERHRHRGFDRAAFLAAIEEATGVDARDFFAAWVDSRQVPPARTVDRALKRAIGFGVFADD